MISQTAQVQYSTSGSPEKPRRTPQPMSKLAKPQWESDFGEIIYEACTAAGHIGPHGLQGHDCPKQDMHNTIAAWKCDCLVTRLSKHILQDANKPQPIEV